MLRGCTVHKLIDKLFRTSCVLKKPNQISYSIHWIRLLATMTDSNTNVIDGNKIAEELSNKSAERITKLKEHSLVVGLTVIIVGNRTDSATYVRMKEKAAQKAGILSRIVRLPDDVSESELLEVLTGLNEDNSVHGILVQLPLPDHIDEDVIISHISPKKDVDGLLPINVGHLAQRLKGPYFLPCTPLGCMELLRSSGVEIAGKDAVVLGRSKLVGTPMALLLANANATVTICHSRTKNLEEKIGKADILVAAIGKPEFVKGEWLKPDCVVIDVGINQKTDASRKSGYRLVGDVDYESAKNVASKITPVPGGVGPMTVAMLISNTVLAAERSIALEK